MITDHDNTEDIVENWNHSVPAQKDTNIRKLLSVVARENKRLDLDIEEVYDQRFLSSATGKELEKLGKFVGVDRKNGEGDEKLRIRIRAEFAAQASNATFSDFSAAILTILDASPEAVEIVTPPDTGPKLVEVQIDGSVIADNPLSNTELAELLDKTVSVDGKVNLIETGTFAFAGDDSTLEGWDEGTWSTIIE